MKHWTPRCTGGHGLGYHPANCVQPLPRAGILLDGGAICNRSRRCCGLRRVLSPTLDREETPAGAYHAALGSGEGQNSERLVAFPTGIGVAMSWSAAIGSNIDFASSTVAPNQRCQASSASKTSMRFSSSRL